MRMTLLAGTALATAGLLCLASPTLADDAAILKQLDQMQMRLDAQEQSIAAQKAEIAKLKAALAENKAKPAPVTASKAAPVPPAAISELSDTVAKQQIQIDNLRIAANQEKIKAAEQPSFTLNNGRPSFTTASGNFSAALRALVQLDGAYYTQGGSRPASASDLNSGTNFRRARIGLSGKLYNVWDYYFLYDFGGSGVESSAISSAFLQYNGFSPVQLRAGTFPPSASLEDSEGAGDPLFMEKASAVEITRGIAGSDGRVAVAAISSADNYYVSLAYSGNKVGQSGTFDEQQATIGRLAFAPLRSPKSSIVLGINGSYVFDTADAAAGPGAASTGINFQNSPELRVDDTSSSGTAQSLVSTGNINANSAYHWGLDGAANWQNFYSEGGYYEFGADRRGVGALGSDPHFSGWYAEASWVLTGESRRYDASSAVFRSPQAANLVNGAVDGWGAWEIAARYSTVDLNYNSGIAGAATPIGGIRGGEQDIWTFGVNWYPNNAQRFLLNYQNDRIRRINAAGVQAGQDLNAISLRLQVQL